MTNPRSPLERFEASLAIDRDQWRDGIGAPDIRMAVLRYAPDLADISERVSALVHALENAPLEGGLAEALEQAARFHPPPVHYVLLRGLLEREGEAAVHFAALLYHIHGKSPDIFDWSHRPFFLRFNTADKAKRRAAYHELCESLGLPPLPGT